MGKCTEIQNAMYGIQIAKIYHLELDWTDKTDVACTIPSIVHIGMHSCIYRCIIGKYICI